MDKLTVIEGGGEPEPYRNKRETGVEMLVCKCGSSTFVKVTTGLMLEDNEIVGGTEQLVCFRCEELI